MIPAVPVGAGELVAAAVLSALGAAGMGILALPVLQQLRLGQAVRPEGPSTHWGKAGTPTMGGVIFLVPAVLVGGFFAPTTLRLLALVAVTLGFALLGALDDYLKAVRRHPVGLKARHKLAAQASLGLLLAAAAQWSGLGTYVDLPFGLGRYELGPLYPALVVLVLSGAANAVNLTDGVDGLAAGASAIALCGYAWIALARQQGELAVWSLALAGALAGFLLYNAHPARVFMGDSGSLALGGALGALAVLTKTELLLPLVGLLFVVETLSVMAQVTYFRLTGGRRLLRMSPLHHHLELGGWPEPRVAAAFWALSLAGTVAGVWALRTLGG